MWWTSGRPALPEFVENLQAAAAVSNTTLILDLVGGNCSSPGSVFFESLLMARRSTFAAQKSQDLVMKRSKDETLSIRTSSDIKQLLRIAAERERRSIASMIEVLILKYAQEQGLQAEAPSEEETNKGKGNDGAH